MSKSVLTKSSQRTNDIRVEERLHIREKKHKRYVRTLNTIIITRIGIFYLLASFNSCNPYIYIYFAHVLREFHF